MEETAGQALLTHILVLLLLTLVVEEEVHIAGLAVLVAQGAEVLALDKPPLQRVLLIQEVVAVAVMAEVVLEQQADQA
jgi:hypothetical protein